MNNNVKQYRIRMDNYELVAVKVKNSVTYDRTFCQTPVEGNNKCLHTKQKK